MSACVGLDVGTTGARAVAVDESGGVVGEAASSYLLLTPRPQWTEQSPEEWWWGTRQALAEVCSQLRSRHIPIVGLG